MIGAASVTLVNGALTARATYRECHEVGDHRPVIGKRNGYQKSTEKVKK